MKIPVFAVAIFSALMPPIVQAQSIDLVGRPLKDGQGQVCQGDCQNDKDCAGSLTCYQRFRYDYKSVPGCSGGETDGSKTDYCVEPDFFEVTTDLGTYCIGDGIEICFDYTDPEKYDCVAIHYAGETSPLPFPPLQWAFTFTGTHVKKKGKKNYDCITVDSGLFNHVNSADPWPLEPGTYEAWLLRGDGTTGLTSSGSFVVKNCEPTDVPLSESEVPSEVPSEMPSDLPTNGPTVTCVDDPNFKHKGNKKKKCDWVAKKKSRCKKKHKKIQLSVYCPVACDACDSISNNIFS